MKEEIYVREINDRDIEALTKLINELGYSSSVSQVHDRISKIKKCKNYKTLVAELNGEVVGFIGFTKLYAYELDFEYIRVLALSVDKMYRKHGIGRKLIEEAEKYAVEENATAVTLNSGINRKEAHSFYEQLGYSIKGYGFFKAIIK